MNRLEVRERVKLYLGFIASSVLDTTIESAIIQAQVELEKEAELPWFLKKAYSGLATVADTQTLAVPTDFIREFPEDQLFAVNDDGDESPIKADSQGNARLRFPLSSDHSVPKLYAIVKRVFYFYPTPDKIYNLSGTYYATEPTLTADGTENEWTRRLPEILYSKAGFVIASAKRDQTAMQLFAGMLGRATQKLNEMNTADEAAGSKPVIGGED